MRKVLVCVFLVEISRSCSARNNGYFRAFRRGYYPGKPDHQDYHMESKNHHGYSGHHHHGYGYLPYPAVPILGPSPVGHYGYPVYPYHRYGEPDESIYDYKLKVQPKEEERTIENLQVNKPDERAKKVKDAMKIMNMEKIMAEMKRNEEMRKRKEMKGQQEQKKMTGERRKKTMEHETVHAPKYVPMEIPKMVTVEKVEKETYERPEVRTREPPTRHGSKPMKMESEQGSNNAGLVFNGKYPGSCDNDGLYYRDGTSYIICTNTQAIVQPCAPGTQNQDMMTFTPGSEYSKFDFCTINLVARGSYHSFIMMDSADKDEKKEYMNEKVKNYFEQHYRNYA